MLIITFAYWYFHYIFVVAKQRCFYYDRKT